MKKKRGRIAAVLGLAVVVTGSAAQADPVPVLHFAFDKLDGDNVYNAGNQSSTFTAVPKHTGTLISSMSVDRLVGGAGTAGFSPGFVNLPDQSNISISMTVTNITGTDAQVLSGNGFFTITDADGDTISGGIYGMWSKEPQTKRVFTGYLENVYFNGPGDGNGVGDGVFEGQLGDGFSMNFSDIDDEPFIGAIVQIVATGSNKWFNQNFVDRPTTGWAQVYHTPVPGAGALGLLGFAIVHWRKRRQ